MKTINDAIQKFVYEKYGRDSFSYAGEHNELVLGYLRYEALRKLTPYQYEKLCKRNLKGENFDGMVDELVIKNEN